MKLSFVAIRRPRRKTFNASDGFPASASVCPRFDDRRHRKCVASIEKMPSDRVRAIAPVKRQASPNYRLLSKDGRQALGLIVTAVAPMPLVYLKQLFPAFNWASHCRLFRRSNFIKKSETLIQATAGAARSFTDASEQKEFNQLWIAALTPFAGHVDLSLFLTIHLMRDDKIDEAANLVASVAEETDVGQWVQAYMALLTGMANAAEIQKLTPETRLHVLNALGTCHSQNEDPTTALKCFDGLQRQATKLADRHRVGQYLAYKR